MADQKKLTTQEILALARKKAAGGDAGSTEPAADAAAPTEEAAASSEATAQEPSKPAPKSTADILAAARAQKAAKSESGDAPAAKPSSTADILAAARAQKAGGTAPAAGDAPKSTADILAAARAQKAGGAAPSGGSAPKSTADILAAARAGKAPAADKPAATEKAAVAKKDPVAGSTDKPAIKDMVAAVRESQAGGTPKLPGKPIPAQPKLPPKKVTTRRRFIEMLAVIAVTPFAVGWTAVGGIVGLWSLGIARFMMPNMVLELPSQFKVGLPSEFPPGVVSEKYKASRGVWIVNSSEVTGSPIIYALLSICTHLGCTPNWLSGEQKFKCPCHGSGFYITGVNFEGPAPRPLERVGLRIAEDGSLEVDKSLKFQEELGQWSDPKSFVEVV